MTMLNSTLANFYERDISRLIEEINLFHVEENLWKTAGTIKNSSGNLVLHIVGGTNYLIGAMLAKTGYVRNRDQEFIIKGVPRTELVAQLEALMLMISKTLSTFDDERMEAEYPIMFDDMKVPNSYILIRLAIHLNYHLGQVNYLRRVLE
ncbi:DinB family protein [Mucilaginibacter sp. RCC_168]|uniref:DinB family protein n=1 Tax=Mucilaginibacter sp. RCC_168 TaxID=3239221 RepID=UPI00352598C9